MLVSGEPGVGKTALVNGFCEKVAGLTRVVVGRCDDMSAPRPLAPFFDIAHMGDGGLGLSSVAATVGRCSMCCSMRWRARRGAARKGGPYRDLGE